MFTVYQIICYLSVLIISFIINLLLLFESKLPLHLIKNILFFFIDLKDFVLSSFNSSSYYVRKSSMNFFINFILQWTSYLSNIKQKKPEDLSLEAFMKSYISFIVDRIHFYRNIDEMVFAECCITILKQILESESSEFIVKNASNLSENISDCFIELSEEDRFNEKLIGLFLAIHFK